MAEKEPGNRLRRACKENNLFHVKRLIQRIDMRNPDPGPDRYTSLAWAAVLGNEETFEYLLTAGHDDEELSKDGENNTILVLLAGLGGAGPQSAAPRSATTDVDLRDAALRMARQYYDRYPFILDWSNSQGKTALHVAAVKGNEEIVRMFCDLGADFDMPDGQGNTPLHYASAWGHIHIIQLLIERGCQYASRNIEGFTASDYAYSTSTWDTLQETARAQFEHKKTARRNVFAQAAARGNEWRKSGIGDTLAFLPREFETDAASRLRSGSGGSRTTMTSDEDNFSMPGPSSFTSSMSSQQSLAAANARGRNAPSKSPSLNALSSSYALTNRPPPPKTPQHDYSSVNKYPFLSPVATRMREKDADAIAEYKKRSRSGSGGSAAPTLFPPPVRETLAVVAQPERRLRPSLSAASLRNVMSALTSSPPPTTTQLPPIHGPGTAPVIAPEKSGPRKLISSRALLRNRPGTAPGDTLPAFPTPALPVSSGSFRKLPFLSRNQVYTEDASARADS